MKKLLILSFLVFFIACSASKKESEIIYNDCSVRIISGNWYAIDMSGNQLYNNPFETIGPFDIIKVLKIEKENRLTTIITAVYYEKKYKDRPKLISAIDTATFFLLTLYNI
ncbi:hypothetical protein DSECCO2_643120 [anaerobic digester metagenome]